MHNAQAKVTETNPEDEKNKELLQVIQKELDITRERIAKLKERIDSEDPQEKEKEIGDKQRQELAELKNRETRLLQKLQEYDLLALERIEQLKKEAETNPDAMHTLGELYVFGKGVSKNIEKTKKLLERAVALDHSDSMTSFGLLYHRGIHLPKDVSKAEAYYKQAVLLKNSRAMVKLAELYLYEPVQSKGAQGLSEKAIELLERAIALENNEAMVVLAELYLEGKKNVPKNIEKAITLLKQAGRLGNSAAWTMLGNLFRDEENLYDAKIYYERAVKLNDSQAMVSLAELLWAENIRLHQARVLELFEKAAELGNPVALNRLGNIYENGALSNNFGGQITLTRNVLKAKKSYEKAAQLGNSEAMLNLGNLYEKGSKKIEINYSKAAKLYAKSHRLGNEFAYGSLYEMSRAEWVPTKKSLLKNAEAQYRLASIKNNNSSYSIFSTSKENQLINALKEMEPNKAIKRLQKCWESSLISSANALIVLTVKQKEVANVETKNAINFLFAKIYLAEGKIQEAEQCLNQIENPLGLSGNQLHEIGQNYMNLIRNDDKAAVFLEAARKAGCKAAEIELEMSHQDEPTATERVENNPLAQLKALLIQLRLLLPKIVRGERLEVMDSPLWQLSSDQRPLNELAQQIAPELENILDIYDSIKRTCDVSIRTREIFNNLHQLLKNNEETIQLPDIEGLANVLDEEEAKLKQIKELIPESSHSTIQLPFFSKEAKADEFALIREVVFNEDLFAYEKLQRLREALSPENSSNNSLSGISQQLRVQLVEILDNQKETHCMNQFTS